MVHLLYSHRPGDQDWTDRQNRVLTMMWADPTEYSLDIMAERFLRSANAIQNQAVRLGLGERPKRVAFTEPEKLTAEDYKEIRRRRSEDIKRRRVAAQDNPISVVHANSFAYVKRLDAATSKLIEDALAKRGKKPNGQYIRYRIKSVKPNGGGRANAVPAKKPTDSSKWVPGAVVRGIARHKR